MNQTAEQNRRIESAIRQGIIAEVDCAAARCRVKSGELLLDWLPWFAPRAGQTREWSPPTVGEQCLVFSPSGGTESGFVLMGIFSDAIPAPSASPDEHLTQYPDGAKVLYNHASGAMSITGVKTLVIEAANSIVFKSASITLDAPTSESTGKHTVKGLFSYLSGLFGRGGSRGSTISGDLTHESGQLSSHGVVLHTHVHPVHSNVTDEPQ